MKRVKVHATLGPTSSSEATISEMIKAGADGFRINFSHASCEEALKTINIIRKASSEIGKPVSIRMDLAGPKIRVGSIENDEAYLADGAEFILSGRQFIGNKDAASITYSTLAKDVSKGQRILLADGSIELVVKDINDLDITCEVVSGGILKSRKGVNIPRANLQIDFLTSKDIQDMEFGVKNGVDYVTLSFVKKAEDVLRVKQMVRDMGADTPIITKIETAEAVENIDAILEVTDGISIARGDLGVEWGIEELPLINKLIVQKSLRDKKFVMMGAQTLMSMIDNPYPTRAEVTDVVNSILDGVDVINLSDETAVGKHPVEVIKVLERIICKVESALLHPEKHPYTKIYSEHKAFYDTLTTNLTPGMGDYQYLVLPISSYEELTAIRKNTTGTIIFACTDSEVLANRMASFRGVVPMLFPNTKQKNDLLSKGLDRIKDKYRIDEKELLILKIIN